MTRKQSEIAAERWERLSEEERLSLRKEIGAGMRGYWSKLTPEQRSEIGRKAAETRKRNRILKAIREKHIDYMVEGDAL